MIINVGGQISKWQKMVTLAQTHRFYGYLSYTPDQPWSPCNDGSSRHNLSRTFVEGRYLYAQKRGDNGLG